MQPTIARAVEARVAERLQIEAAIAKLRSLDSQAEGRTRTPAQRKRISRARRAYWRRVRSGTTNSNKNSDAASERSTRRESKRSGKKRGAGSRRR